MSNYINKVAKVLNLELGQEFIVTDIVGKVFWFTKAIQCVANLVMGLTDLRARKLLIKR